MFKESLERGGLSAKEAAIYLALLELGKTTTQHISKRCRLSRSTVYSVLEQLAAKGLVAVFDEKKIRHYLAEDPNKILQGLSERFAAVRMVLPDLKEIYKATKVRPQMKFYEGNEAIREMYKGILKEPGLKGYDIIASEEDWLKMNPRFFENFKKRRAAHGIHTRLLLEHSQTARERKVGESATNSEVKIIPPALCSDISAGCYIFKQKVIFLAYRKEHVACEIYSQEIAGLLQMMFNFIWHFLAK
jgi:HTH-type transcriptional regulator, sugar sensing transcriptional regulator